MAEADPENLKAMMEELLAREEAVDSLAKYIEYVSGMKPPRHIELLCEKLEAVADGRIKRLMISMPPGHAKSFTASQHFPAWYLSKYGKKNLICATHTQELSDSFGLKVRNLMKSDEHRKVFPEAGISLDKTAAGEWMTLEDGSYKATAVGASVTGRRGHMLIGDDLLSGIEAAESESHRRKLWAWYNSDFYTRRVDDDTSIILIGTRWHLGDHFGMLDQEERDGTGEKWERVILPALALEDDPLGRKPGEALWESQFSKENLERIRQRSSTTARMWSSLYQQNPVVDSGGIIDGTWFKWWRQPEPPKVQYVIQAWDTALTANKTSAYSASTTWGVFEDENGVPNIILLSAWRDRAEWPVLRRMVQRMANDYRDDNYKLPIKPQRGRKPDTILVEAKANGQMLILDLAKAGLVATPFNPDKFGDKIARVRLVTDLIENGRVWLPAAGPTYQQLRKWAEEFMQQCIQFPAADARDWVDTMTMAFLRIKQSGWVANTEDPYEERYDTPLEQAAFY
jgi:predicted phage terminase large subunit-like protein